jgi:hypothetical protein
MYDTQYWMRYRNMLQKQNLQRGHNAGLAAGISFKILQILNAGNKWKQTEMNNEILGRICSANVLFLFRKMSVFWVVAPCSLVEAYQRFISACCLHHQGDE